MTLKEISELTGYSISVVSRALNPKPDKSSTVSEKTRAKIISAVENLGYQRNLHAACVRLGKNPAIGVMMRRLRGSLGSDLLTGLTESATRAGISLSFYFPGMIGLREFMEKMIADRNIGCAIDFNDSALGDSCCELKKLFPLYIRNGGKVVFLDCGLESPSDFSPGQGTGMVRQDDFKGGAIAAEFLLSQRCGRYFVWHPTHACYFYRRDGFCECMRRAGIAPEVFSFPQAINYSSEILKLFRRCGFEPGMGRTGLFVPSDFMALAVDMFCRDRGIRVGEELVFVGYNDDRFVESLPYPFPTVRQDYYAMGCDAVDQLAGMLNEQPGKNCMIEPKLVVRPSLQEGAIS